MMQLMNQASKDVIRTYLTLMLLSTLAASMIWGINTLFLLDAGLNNTEAFLANAFFTVGQVIFEVPTGVIADGWGRRTSYLLGSITLFVSTLLYFGLWVTHGPIWQWALVSVFLGLGFTFFSGAVEAWLVDALAASKYKGELDDVFAKGQIVAGGAMLVGSVAGGVIAQVTNLGVPFVLRGVLLFITFLVAWLLMHDIGFTPEKATTPLRQVRTIFNASIQHGLKNPPVRWLMLAAPFGAGVGIYTFYALQPYLLQLYGNSQAYGIAGLVAAIVAGAQVGGGILAPRIRHLFKRRTTAVSAGVLVSGVALILLRFIPGFWVALVLIVIWAIVFAAITPIRQAFINGLIPSKQRATVLSFDALMGSSGGVVIQPVLGRAADVYSYGTSYLFAGVIQLMALPFTLLARRENAPTDIITSDKPVTSGASTA